MEIRNNSTTNISSTKDRSNPWLALYDRVMAEWEDEFVRKLLKPFVNLDVVFGVEVSGE